MKNGLCVDCVYFTSVSEWCAKNGAKVEAAIRVCMIACNNFVRREAKNE